MDVGVWGLKSNREPAKSFFFFLLHFRLSPALILRYLVSRSSMQGMYDPSMKNNIRGFNNWVNSLLFPSSLSSSITNNINSYFHSNHSDNIDYHAHCYIRNFIAGSIIYYSVALFFSYRNYIHPRSIEIFKDRERPSLATIRNQICLAQSSLFIYVMLPVLSDYLMEEGYTQAYYSLADVGGFFPYLAMTLVYFVLVEISIYWMHRTLHTNKFCYKYIHSVHHQYNKPETLTPWASIAFHPLDGILQASPYVFWLHFVPCHYFTHVGMVFGTAIWATYIHDAMDGNVEPIMSNKYHTIHHTHYHYNYGQIFIFCDRFWGTLRVPQEKTGVTRWAKKQKLMKQKKGEVDFEENNIEKPAKFYEGDEKKED